MSKRVIQDVFPPNERRSIRNIQLPKRGAENSNREVTPPVPNVKVPQEVKAQNTENSRPASSVGRAIDTPSYNSPTNSSTASGEEVPPYLPIPTVLATTRRPLTYKVALAGGILAALAFIYLGYLFLNVGALVTITPKSETIAIKGLYAAKKNVQPGDLPFEVISIEDESAKTVPATGEKTVENRATGRAIIYNDYSQASQRLIKNTRLQTPEGLIFRIDTSVVVPGQTKKEGKTLPGSVEASVSADTAGAEYNIPLSDFTIPGFKGDPRYEKFYARSKTTMSGGFKGTVKTASTKDLEVAKSELTADLRTRLIKEVKQQIPTGFILYDNAVYSTAESLSVKDSNEVKIKASVHGIILRREALASYLAGKSLSTYNGEAISSPNLENLQFKPDSLEIAPWQTGNLPFTLSGTTTLVFVIDEEKMRADLAGISKTEVENVFKNYNGIDRAEVKLRPAWKSTLPQKTDNIEIVVKKPGS